MKIFRRLIVLAFAMLWINCVRAQDTAETLEALVVTVRDGSVHNFFLVEKPEVTFNANVCHIVSSTASVDYDIADVIKTEFLQVKKPNSIESVVSERQLGVDLSRLPQITVSGVASGSMVRLFTIDGKLAAASTAGEDGIAVINAEGIAPAVCVLATENNKSIKLYLK